MLTIIFGAIAGVLCFLYLIINGHWTYCFAGIGVGGVIGFIVSLLIGIGWPTEERVIDEGYLVANNQYYNSHEYISYFSLTKDDIYVFSYTRKDKSDEKVDKAMPSSHVIIEEKFVQEYNLFPYVIIKKPREKCNHHKWLWGLGSNTHVEKAHIILPPNMAEDNKEK